MISSDIQQNPIDRIIDHVRAALVAGLLETGHAHFEIDCKLINKEKDIARIELMLGTKYSFTVSRQEVRTPPKVKLRDDTQSNRLGP